MRVENIVSEPIKTTYKVGVYGAMGFVGVFLVTFIAWSFSCLGGAVVDMAMKMV